MLQREVTEARDTMKTGTDVSLRECRESGYPVVEHGKKPMDPKKNYHLTISNPRHWGKPGTRSELLYATNIIISYKDLWESFERGGQEIKDFCDFKNCPHPSPEEEPSYHDFVNLAQTVVLYHGLD